MRVLIVDDSEVFVQHLRSRLAEIIGLEIVGQAGNVADATSEIRKARPDVVILDIRIPGGSGFDVLEGIGKEPAKPIVVMLTNCSGSQYRKKCLQDGARFFFDKSTEFHEIAQALRSLMGAVSA
jgi:DNA-binding NarL/FixJ family response regulator